MMRKYIPILPMWTCLIVADRQANGRLEVLFNIIKKRIHIRALKLGTAPLKVGRFLKETRKYINEIIVSYELDMPRERLCTPSQKRSLQFKDDDSDKENKKRK